MFDIHLRNGKRFNCDATTTVLEAAKKSGIILEYSCLSARCRSCMVLVNKGEVAEISESSVLSAEEVRDGYALSCNVQPRTDLYLDIEDLGDYDLNTSRTLPCKISELEYVSSDVIKLKLRLPPNSNFKFLSGQYVNLIKGAVSRSYSIANAAHEPELEFFIKNYENGVMSKYWFTEAKINDLLRLQGPLGTFFLRKPNPKNLVFLATGTGIAPVKSILQGMAKEEVTHKSVLVIWGGRYAESLFLDELPFVGHEFIKVVSRPDEQWKGETGYVQEVLLRMKDNFKDTVVYACGSDAMIATSRELLKSKGLPVSNFYSDAFVSSN